MGPPEQLVDPNRLAALLKAARLPLDPTEVDYTLSGRFKYARHDLVIVDWDGAVVCDPEGDVEWAIELLELGNLQLLRYRLLDRELDERLHRVARLVEDTSEDRQGLFKPSEIRQALRELMRVRSTSIVDFQDVEREIKLIGDWYCTNWSHGDFGSKTGDTRSRRSSTAWRASTRSPLIVSRCLGSAAPA
jgi:hypothetical protein